MVCVLDKYNSLCLMPSVVLAKASVLEEGNKQIIWMQMIGGIGWILANYEKNYFRYIFSASYLPRALLGLKLDFDGSYLVYLSNQ